MNEKFCSKCKQTLPLDCFGKDSRNLSGLTANCKKCRYAMSKNWSLRNPEKLKQYRKEAWAKHSGKLIEKQRQYNKKNRDLINARAKARYHEMTEDQKYLGYLNATKAEMKNKYRINQQIYDAILADQGNKCAICGRENGCRSVVNGVRKNKRLFIDHDHSSGLVRGLLCHRCNSGLGMFRDDIELLIAAVTYLKKYQNR